MLFAIEYNKVIRFAPLAIDQPLKLFKYYQPFIDYIKKETGYTIELVYYPNYKKSMEALKNGELEIGEYGPLAYVQLYNECNSAQVFLASKSKNNKAYYNCKIVTTDSHINKISDITNNVHFNLTRKTSTCGYLIMEKMLQEQGKTLENLSYEYKGPHTETALDTILEYNSVGGIKLSVYQKYKDLGLKVIATSGTIMGFPLVYNNKLVPKVVIENIKKSLLKLNPFENVEHKELMKKWSKNCRYGYESVTHKDYLLIDQAMKDIVIP